MTVSVSSPPSTLALSVMDVGQGQVHDAELQQEEEEEEEEEEGGR